MAAMSTHSLRELHADLGNVVLEVAYTGEEAIVTDSGTEVAVIISFAEYERLQARTDRAAVHSN
jgi:antitoxin YefM